MLDETQFDNMLLDILDCFEIAMAFEGIDYATRRSVLGAVEDGLTNNLFERYNV